MSPESLEANPPASAPATVTPGIPEVPHTLWKQLLALCVAGVVVLLSYGAAGVLIAATGVVVFADAWIAGVFKKRGGSGFLNISPAAWGIATMGLFIVAYPLYAFNRNRLKTRQGKNALFVAVNVLGGLLCVFAILQFAIRVMPH